MNEEQATKLLTDLHWTVEKGSFLMLNDLTLEGTWIMHIKSNPQARHWVCALYDRGHITFLYRNEMSKLIPYLQKLGPFIGDYGI